MAVTNEKVAEWLASSPNLTDDEIARAMVQFGVSANQMAEVTGIDPEVVQARIDAALPVTPAPVPTPEPELAPEPTPVPIDETAWDYNKYMNSLKVDAPDYTDALATLSSQNSVMSKNAQNVYKEMLAQQQAGSADYWSQGNLGSKKAAAADFALRLAENNIGSLNELGQRSVMKSTGVPDESGNEPMVQTTEYFNKTTGEALPDWDRVAVGVDSFSKLQYNIHFTEDGTAIPYTANNQSNWVQFREQVKPIAGILLSAYGVPYVANALAGTTVGGITLASGSAALTAASSAVVSGGVSLLSGATPKEALKSAVTSGLTAGAAAGYADTIGQALGFDAGSIASKAAGQAIIAGVKAGVTDENVLQNMATAAVATYLSNKTPVFDATANEGSLAKLNEDSFDMTTDFGSGADYSLTSNLKSFPTEGIKVDDRGFGDNYDLTTGATPFTGLQTTSPNLTAMGGAQGVTVGRDDGTTLSGKDFTTGPSLKDIETVAKVGGVLMAGDAVIDKTIGSSFVTKPNKDIYRDAPLAGFKMVKYEDSASGASKYIPFVGEEALLPPPTGYNRTSFAKGGLASRRI